MVEEAGKEEEEVYRIVVTEEDHRVVEGVDE